MPGVSDTLFHIIHFALWIAAICGTAYPLIYAWAPWYRSVLGRALMLYSVSFAVILDLTLLFAYWTPDSLQKAFWVEVCVFCLIAISSVFLTVILLVGMLRKHPTIVPPEIDGVMAVTQVDGKKTFSMEFEGDPVDLDKQEYVTFRVEKK